MCKGCACCLSRQGNLPRKNARGRVLVLKDTLGWRPSQVGWRPSLLVKLWKEETNWRKHVEEDTYYIFYVSQLLSDTKAHKSGICSLFKLILKLLKQDFWALRSLRLCVMLTKFGQSAHVGRSLAPGAAACGSRMRWKQWPAEKGPGQKSGVGVKGPGLTPSRSRSW